MVDIFRNPMLVIAQRFVLGEHLNWESTSTPKSVFLLVKKTLGSWDEEWDTKAF